jgi:hypothetical protein
MRFTLRRTACLGATALGLAIVSLSLDAHALGPVDLEIAAKAGGATNPRNQDPPNPLGFGIGGRAGVVFLGGGYVGGNVLYYGPEHASSSTLMYGGELGYGWKLLDIVTIRPQIGLGNATFTSTAGGENTSSSSSYFYLEPGVTGLVALGSLLVGADANALFLPGLNNSNAAFTLHAQVGIKF